MTKLSNSISQAIVSMTIAVFFISIILLSFSMNAAKNNATLTPDFAYPKTVQKNADKNLVSALKANDWQKITVAMIQKVTAANLISNDSVNHQLSQLDSIIKKAPTEWKPTLQLVEADIYNSIYNHQHWKADNRKLPADSIPSSPFEWSRDIFANKTLALCQAILNNKANDKKSLKIWGQILSNTGMAFKYGMTIDEFLSLKCAELLNVYADETQDVIPFFPNTSAPVTPGQKCRALRDEAIDMLIEKSSTRRESVIEAEALAQKADYMSHNLRHRFLMSALDKVKDTEGSQLILQRLESNVAPDNGIYNSSFRLNKKQYVEMLEKSIIQFPKGIYVNALKNILSNYTSPSAFIQYKNQYLTSSDISMDVTLTNCNQSYILVYDFAKYENAKESPSNQVMAANCRLVKAVKVTANGTVPFFGKNTANIGKLPVGTYTVVPSATPDHKGIYPSIAKQRWHQPFAVSNILVYSLNNLDATTRVFVVDGADGHPIEGATVKVFTRKNYNSDRLLTATMTTNKDGFVIVSEKNCDIEAYYKGSRYSNDYRIYNSEIRNDTTALRHLSILPDRSIYHPGDSICIAFIAYTSKGSDMNLSSKTEYTINLLDANGKKVASQSAVSDSFGRATISFQIPNDGMLGQWSLSSTDENGRLNGYATFQVAEYVAPTFFISPEKSENEHAAGDVVNLKGQVLTYSGMPLANAKVDYTVRYRSPMRWYMPSGATFDSSVTTDDNGYYSITLPTTNLKDTQFERGVFTVGISATSPAGETQSGPSEQFALGQEFSIDFPYSNLKMEISDSIPSININVKDILGRNVNKQLKYTLKNVATSKVVAEGLSISPSLALPEQHYPSAKYELSVELVDDPDITANLTMIMWRKSDTSAPEGTKLWIPESDFYAKSGENEVNVTIGSGISDCWLPIVISGDNKLIDFKWIHVEHDNVVLPVQIPMNYEKNLVNVNFVSNLNIENASVNIFSSEAYNNLNIITESFRDKISAGDEEHWKFHFGKKYGTVGEIPVLAVMTDASLNHLAPFKWNFNPSSNYHSVSARFNTCISRDCSIDFSLRNYKYFPTETVSFPKINDYGQNWGIGHYFSDAVYYGVHNDMKLYSKAMATSQVMSRGMAEDNAAPKTEAIEEELAEEMPQESATGATDSGKATDAKELRESECPIAFFMPYLTTDKEGIVDINFTVPNFNTTWALQILGYDENLQTSYKQLETVASKPIMVSTHSPRFVRTGDVIQLTATVFNNTGKETDAQGRIELINLFNGKTIASKDFSHENLEAAGSRIITMQWPVPSDISSVGFRAFAEADGHRDGEQALLPVLPATSPVVESTPFWLAPNQNSFEIKLPRFKDTDQVTLQYCDNPVWYCLTALPDIIQSDSKSILIKIENLFGNAMAFNLISSNTTLKTGLETLLSDKNSRFAAIKSNLEKNGNLKIAKLSNTPWVNDAESETLRMSRLSTLLDSENAKKTISEQIEELKNLQYSEGGWSWCPDMQPSSYITRLILDHFSMLTKAGALKSFTGTDKMIKDAIRFVDSETLKDYKKYHKKDESLCYLLDWLYTRSGFAKEFLPGGSLGKEMNSIIAKAEKDMASEWKSMDIRDKANAAVVLWRAGNSKVASEILESLRQFASETYEKGVWFDNLNSGFGGHSALQTTTSVLEAYSEIQPANGIIDGIRQWLILSRQVQDWGKNRCTVETVNAILSSGSEWTNTADEQLPGFALNSNQVNIPTSAALTGAFTVNLDAKKASGKKLKISRRGNSPAWGGVISQYEATMKDVVAAEIPQLSIRKQVVALVDEGNGTLVPKEDIDLKKGMKVRVTLTITNDRGMDYMAITDERSACLEPADQLSHYTSTDRVRYYKEVRNESTNIYIEHLPKGHHVISYDCTASQDGTFSCGIATIQSQYSPLVTAHSAAFMLQVE